MVVPLPIVALGVIAAAVLGFVAGWLMASGRSGSSKAPRVSAGLNGDGVSSSPSEIADSLQEVWRRLEPPRIVIHYRLDAADTWRRTRGQATNEHFLSQMVMLANQTLSLPWGHEVRGDEVVIVAPGDAETAGQLSDALRAHRFTHLDGDEALVTATGGTVEDAGESLQVNEQKAFAAMSEAGRRRRGTLAKWTPGGVRHLRPVEAQT